MDKKQILANMQEVFRDVLENEQIVLANEISSSDIDEWDSLAHIQLIVAIEKHFSIKFTAKEMLSWSNIGDMIDCISTK